MRWLWGILFAVQCGLCAGQGSIQPSRQNEWGIIDLIVPHLCEQPNVVLAGGDVEVLKRMLGLWPQGRVFVFEPNPHLMRALKDLAGYYPKLELSSCALDKESGRAPFYLSRPAVNPRIGSLLPAVPEWKWYYTDRESIEVERISLQRWAKQHKIDAIDFIWLNAGGSELRILESAPQLVQTVKFALIETHEQRFRQGMGCFEEVVAFFDRAGFELIHQWSVPGYQGYSLFMRRGFKEVIRW